MKRFNEYADSVADFAQPYKEKTARFFADTKDAIEDKYYHEKKKYYRKRRKNKIKKALEGAVGTVIFIVSLMIGISVALTVAYKFFGKKSNVCKIKPVSKKNAENLGENKPKEKTRKEKKNSGGSGYITL